MRLFLFALLLALPGCATWEQINFGLDLANAESSVSVRQGGGKTVLTVEQEGLRVTGFFGRGGAQ
jgi:hypothetical protein